MSTVSERLAIARAETAERNKLKLAEKEKEKKSEGSTGPQQPKSAETKETKKDNVKDRRAVNMKRYSDVMGATGGGKMTTKKWNDDSELPNIPVYSIADMTVDNLCLLGAATFKQIKNHSMTPAVADGILYLATNLRNPYKSGEALLSKPTEKFGKASALTVDVNSVQAEPIQAARVRSKRMQEIIDKRKAEEAANIAAGKQSAPAPVSNDSKEDQVAAYCFLAAYIMRLFSKNAKSFSDSFDLMRERYNSWYSGGSAITDAFVMEEAEAETLKGVLTKRPMLLSTWIMWVSYNENVGSLDKNEKGIMEYLSGQVFAYTGLHVVNQTLAIQQVTKCDMAFLLSELESPMTRSIVHELYTFLKEHEITTKNPNGTTFFRYARNWDSGYFAPLQTKRCMNLVYLTSKVIKLIAPTDAKSDPMKIYGLSNLGAVTREKLDRVAASLSDMLTRVEDDDETGLCWLDMNKGESD